MCTRRPSCAPPLYVGPIGQVTIKPFLLNLAQTRSLESEAGILQGPELAIILPIMNSKTGQEGNADQVTGCEAAQPLHREVITCAT